MHSIYKVSHKQKEEEEEEEKQEEGKGKRKRKKRRDGINNHTKLYSPFSTYL